MTTRITNSRLRLLHISTVPYALYFLLPHFRALQGRNVEVDVVSAPGAELDRLKQDENVNTHAVVMTRRITPLRDLIALFQLVILFRKLRPDIVHAHTPKGGLLGMLAAWISGVPVRIYHIHGLPLETASGLKRTFLGWSDKIACLCAHQVYSVSPSLRNVVLGEKLCSANKIRELHHGSISGIDAICRFAPDRLDKGTRMEVRARWGIGRDDLVVGFVGRLVRDKGLQELSESWQTLKKEFANLHLLIVGALDTAEPELAAMYKQLQEDEFVHLVGMDRDTPRLYSAMDVVAFPTYREGLGLVILEAGAMQLPVVANRVTGCVDAIIEDVTGRLVPPRDATSLTNALRGYLADPELRDRHGKEARRHVVARFNTDDVLSAMFGEYSRLLSRIGKTFPAESTVSYRAA